MSMPFRRPGASVALLGALLLGTACAGESVPASDAAGTTAAAPAAAPATPAGASLASADSAPAASATLAAAPHVTVYKSPTCGCCRAWVDHLRENGFVVTEHDTDDMAAVKREHGVTGALESCHTGIVDGYVIEGHVPADLVAKLLTERPQVAGLAVPGMPMGSPGMEGPRKEAYDVLAFQKDGRTTVFARR